MRNRFRLKSAFGRSAFVTPILGLAAAVGVAAQSALGVNLTQITTGFNGLIGIDHHAPTNQVLVSVFYPTGQPYNFELVAADGTHAQFSAISGLTNEIKIATARDDGGGMSIGGFPAGEFFTGSGVPGEIVRVSPDGAVVQNPWVTLPGETGLLRGSLHVDRTGVYGGDLIVVTTSGKVWQVDSAGNSTQLASLGTHLEGLTTVPNDPVKYGPWAGKILAGAEQQGRIYSIDPAGNTAFFTLGIDPEDIDIIPANENFFGVDFGSQTLWGAPPSEFAGLVGDVLIAEEFPGILWHVKWDAASNSFQVTNVAQVTQWEHVTFSTAGIVEIPPIDCNNNGIPDEEDIANGTSEDCNENGIPDECEVAGVGGSVFLTGHDPDFHASLGGNAAGAQNINIVAISFVMDPAFNPFVAGGINQFLFVQSNIAPPGGHTNGLNGIIASGFILGTDFEHHDATTLNDELDELGTSYSAIVIASDFGGILTQAELDILNARSADIITFLNAGGGLYALAESNSGAHLTPNGRHFGFLPFVVSSTQFNQAEVGNVVTPFGASLGLVNADVNGNASHNIFTATSGLSIVDFDPQGNILSLAGRGVIDPGAGFVDCNSNGIPDDCDVDDGTSADCNENGIPDECDIASGTSQDVNGDGIPDECLVVGNLDIKPGSCPNSYNRNSHGVLPVALVGTDTFDPMDVDLSTVLLTRADGVGGSVAPHEGPPGPHSEFEDVAEPFDGELCDCHELEGDGLTDLSMKFKTDDVVAALQLNDLPAGDLVRFALTGNFFDGTPFSADDCIRLVPPGTPPGMLLVGSNLPGAWLDIGPLDLQLDGGGFVTADGMFERTFPQTTVVTLTAPAVYHGWVFSGWLTDGGLYPGQSIDITIGGEQQRATAIYAPAGPATIRIVP